MILSRFSFIVLAAIGLNSSVAAQTNVRAWNANGQVFIVWETNTQTTLTYQVHRSKADVDKTSRAELLGQVFEPEWTGSRLQLASKTATWRVPDGKGGSYQLSGKEGLFVFTPHASDTFSAYFWVTRNNDSSLSSLNRTAQVLKTAYDPAASPVKCHLQLTGTTQGFPYAVYAMWVDGRTDPNDARPDFPVLANKAKNGAPHVFAVFRPQGALPTNPYPAVVCLHGGGEIGSYWAYAPNSFHYGNTGNAPVNGITIAFDDRLFLSSNGVLNLDRPTNWFGWHTQMSATTATNAPANALVVPYTLRRLMWTIDWLIQSSPFNIDSNRVSIMGNSMGGTGTLLLSRWKPERFASASAFVPPHYTPETAGRLFGTTQTNLRTTEKGPDGSTLRVNDFFNPAQRISSVSRDYCLTRIYRGRCDDAAEWGPDHIKLYNDLNNSGKGIHLYWDNRDHTASDWTTDTPGDTCMDIGQWVSPVRTERCAASYQGRFRSNRSYPGFYNDDQKPSVAGVQPAMGNGSVLDGDAWGTWSGYYDWDVNNLVDTANRWECTLFLVGKSTVSVDNFPGDSATCNLSIRKPQNFRPKAGNNLQWKLIRLSDDNILQAGVVQPDAESVVSIKNLTLYKDPLRTRLVVEENSTSGLPFETINTCMKVYPNPASGKVWISYPGIDELRYRIVGMSGQTFAEGTTSEMSLETNQLPAGLYYLEFTDGQQQVYRRRLIVQHPEQ